MFQTETKNRLMKKCYIYIFNSIQKSRKTDSEMLSVLLCEKIAF
jgi:hypothetical protein